MRLVGEIILDQLGKGRDSFPDANGLPDRATAEDVVAGINTGR
jgi:hypothetical protein